MVYLRAAEDQDKDMGEMWEQTDALMHSHNGFILPENNDPAEKHRRARQGPHLRHIRYAEPHGRRIPRD